MKTSTNEANTSINEVDINDLAEISAIVIDAKLSLQERVQSYFEQVKNPNNYVWCGDTTVKVSYSDTGVSFNDRVNEYLFSKLGL